MRNSRKNNPKNGGHLFQAWCGGEYGFYVGTNGQLHTRPHVDRIQFLADWKTIEDSIRSESWPDKRDHFRKLYYTGAREPGWYSERLGEWVPMREGESRMTVSHPPLKY